VLIIKTILTTYILANMKRRVSIPTMLLITAVLVPRAKAQAQILTEYIQKGLRDNLTITQQNLSLQRALNALSVAKSMYLPSISFDLLYSSAKGGRSIELPIGDMINPVYTTLNQLTQSDNFPQITNESIHFLPRNYYDAKLRTSIPLINSDIRHHKSVQKQLLKLSENELEIYKRDLVQDIKIAYYSYWSMEASIKIYENTLTMAKEGKRVNQKLLEAGKGLPAYVLRAEAEIADAEAMLNEAQQKSNNARYYFNVLLNRDQNAVILPEILRADSKQTAVLLQQVLQQDSHSREEIRVLETSVTIHEMVEKMNKQVYLPKISAFLDLGSQAEGLSVHKNAAYYMIGAQMNFPIFSGNRNKLKIEESKIALSQAHNKLDQARQQLDLAVQLAQNDLLSTLKKQESAQAQLHAAGNYQRLIQRGFNEGVNTYIETIDARTQFTKAQLAYSIATYQILLALTKLERETSSYPL